MNWPNNTVPDDGAPEEGLDLDGRTVAEGGHGDRAVAQQAPRHLVVLVADGAVERRELGRGDQFNLLFKNITKTKS